MVFSLQLSLQNKSQEFCLKQTSELNRQTRNTECLLCSSSHVRCCARHSGHRQKSQGGRSLLDCLLAEGGDRHVTPWSQWELRAVLRVGQGVGTELSPGGQKRCGRGVCVRTIRGAGVMRQGSTHSRRMCVEYCAGLKSHSVTPVMAWQRGDSGRSKGSLRI